MDWLVSTQPFRRAFAQRLDPVLGAAAGLAKADSLRRGEYPLPSRSARRRMPAPRIDRPGLDFAENQACIGSCHLPCCRQNLNRRLTTRKPSFGFGSKRPPAAFAAQVSSLLIRFENVGLRYGMGPEILRDISFQIPERSFQFLSGPSGAGKTSLLRLLFLSLQADPRPDHGVRQGSRPNFTPSELPMLRRRIGVVFQDFACSST